MVFTLSRRRPRTSVAQLKRIFSYLYIVKNTEVFNHQLFAFGQHHCRVLQLWFSAGSAFGFVAMIFAILCLAWQTYQTFYQLFNGDAAVDSSYIIQAAVPGFNMPWSSIGYIYFGTSISVGIHELGHALAAASEGVPIEYVAVFVLFPLCGAFVALDKELMQLLTPLRLLRIHCAGVWHNAMCCAVCWLLLRLLPVIMLPLYMHTTIPVVVSIPLHSPLRGHLNPGDMILSVRDIPVNNSKDWMQNILQQHMTGKEGYCVSINRIQIRNSNSTCTKGLLYLESQQPVTAPTYTCLNAEDILHYATCTTTSTCAQMEECMHPKLSKGEEIIPLTYRQQDAVRCNGCDDAKKILFVGSSEKLAYSLDLSDYLPRSNLLMLWLPEVCEKLIAYTFSISAALALLNSTPVFYLDGEDMLDLFLRIRCGGRRKHRVLHTCLISGSVLLLLGIFPRFLSAMSH